MKDHKYRPVRRRGTRKSVGVRELKTHAARILLEVREARTSYLVTHRGQAVGVILPVDSDEAWQAADAVEATPAWEAFIQAGRRLERRFAPNASGVGLLSDMRR